jgi:Ca2+-binding RTX toxin-like protein
MSLYTGDYERQVEGHSTSDMLEGSDTRDAIIGFGGTDWLYGWGNDDFLVGGGGTDYLYGGAGSDIMWGGDEYDFVSGGDNDYLFAHEETDDANQYGSDQVHGGEGRDEVSYVWARSGVLVNLFESWADEFDSNGDRHRDTLFSIEDASGSWNGDTIYGSNGANILQGFGGNDQIYGNDGNDVIDGGAGADYLESGNGYNRFRYGSITDSEPNAPDTIGDFLSGLDKIDLRLIDANVATSQNEGFKLIGTAGFSGAGQIRYGHKPDGENWQTIVEVNVDGDGRADMEIDLRGVHHLQNSDFVL